MGAEALWVRRIRDGRRARLADRPGSRMVDRLEQANSLEVRVDHEVCERAYRRDGDIGFLEHAHPLGDRLRRCDLLEEAIELVDVLHTRGGGLESRIREEILAAGESEQALPVAVVVGNDRDEAVGRAIGLAMGREHA